MSRAARMMASAPLGRIQDGDAWTVPVGGGLEIVGRSPLLLAAVDIVRRVAPTKLPVLIIGDTGTGKELLARLVHHLSGRTGSLMDIDCGALPKDLIESLLFGHRRGAFTGATGPAQGAIEEADGGTLFLDELGSLPEGGQSKLLRVLETGQVRRVGGTQQRRVDFRVVATMQGDARELLHSGRFRLDLMQRVAGAVVRVPSLAERVGDVLPLARHFAGVHDLTVNDEASQILIERRWAGNVRELRWTVERAALFAFDGVIGKDSVLEALHIGPASIVMPNGHDAGRGDRRAELTAACRIHGGNADGIADSLGIGRSTLYRWLKEERLELRTFKQTGS